MKTLNEPILGTVYLVEENLSIERMFFDLQQIQKKGLNVIVLWPPVCPWDSDDGVSFSFKTIDLFMDECQRLGLQVIVELEGQNPAFQFAPDYQYKPEFTTVSDRARHWVNYYHPQVQSLMKEYVQTVAKHYKDHPALLGYDVFNEVNFHSVDVHTQKAFHQWLEKKYQNIKNLNYWWKRFYKNFDQVHVENLKSNYSRWSSLRHLLDFEEFRADSIQYFVKTWGDWIKEIDDKHLIIADNSWSMTTFDTTILGNDDWKVSQVVDSFGLSVYPQSWDVRLREDPCAVAQIYRGGISAGKESSGKPIMISELQTHNQTALAKGSSVFDEIKLWTWQAFAHGAEGLIYWKWNPFTAGFQVSSRGMTGADGVPNERADQAAACAKILRENKDLFLGREVYHHEVYLLYYSECDRFTDIILPDDLGLYRKSIKAWYEYFWQKGIQPRFISPQDLKNLSVTKESVVVAPMLTMVSKEMALQLKRIVQSEGHLITDGRFALVDENGFAYEKAPGELMDLVGFHELDFLSPYEDGEVEYSRFSKVELMGGQSLMTSSKGDPVVVKNNHTLSFLVPFGVDENSEVFAELLDDFIDEVVNKKVQILEKDDKVDLIISQKAGNWMVNLINYSRQNAVIKVAIEGVHKGLDLWGQADVGVADGVVSVNVGPRGVACIVC